MSAFTLKIIALTAMIIDHTGSVFSVYTPSYFRVIGRLAFPIFVYLIAQGFRHTKSPEKFLLRLFIFAIISEPAFDWALMRSINILTGYSPWAVNFFRHTNIFYTLFLGGMAVYTFKWLYDILLRKISTLDDDTARAMSIFFAMLPVLFFMHMAELLTTDYGAYGVLFIFLMYVIKSKKLMLLVFAIMNVLQHRYTLMFLIEGIPVDPQWLWMIPATLLTVPLIAFYNGKRGPGFKLFFYAAYPVHLVILAVLAWYIL